MIDNGLLLTPKELYCLGGVLSARYIDYAYIAALDDIRQEDRKETLLSDFGALFFPVSADPAGTDHAL